MSKWSTSILVTYCLAGSISYAQEYVTPLLSADWAYDQGPSYCQIQQYIPRYGIAEFVHQSGDLLRFSIKESRYKAEIVKASLVIDSAPWIHQAIPNKDHLVYLDLNIDIQNYPRLSVYGESAEIMLDALSEGMYPTFSYVRASVNGLLSETRVAVSSVNFLSKFERFGDCRKKFLPFGLKTVLEQSIYFKQGKKTLVRGFDQQLNDVARYIKDVQDSRIIISSDTAIAGKKDKKWFLARAAVVEEKLAQLGVKKDKVTISNNAAGSASTNTKLIHLSLFGPDSLNTIYYRKGNTKLTPLEKERLELLVRYSKEFVPDSQLLIKSYTDSKGKRATNLKVSQQRGDVIKRYLESKGMDKDKVVVKAYGESRPVKSNRFPNGRAQNRRVIMSFSS